MRKLYLLLPLFLLIGISCEEILETLSEEEETTIEEEDTIPPSVFISSHISGQTVDQIVTIIATTEDNEGKPKLYTRGNGIYGQDVSHLIPYLNLPKQKDIVVRGEFIISKSIFNEKYKDKFSNSRNLVSGLVNSQKSGEEKYPDISFIVYEVIKPIMNPIEHPKFATKYGFTFCKNVYSSTVSNEKLSEILIDWRQNYDYQIDGLVVTPSIRPRSLNFFIFSMSDPSRKHFMKFCPK